MGDPANTRRTNWKVLWSTVDLGYVDQVSPDLTLTFAPIKVGSIGDVRLGDRFIELAGQIKVQLREVTRVTLQKLCPWATQTANAEIVLTPPANTDMYTYAQALLLHPQDLADATVGEDVEFYKTVPTSAFKLARDGTKDDMYEVTFTVYPKRDSLPALVYGHIKAVV